MKREINPAIKEVLDSFKDEPKKPLMQILMNLSSNYYEAYQTLNNSIWFNQNANLAAPMIMTLSFSIELLLKALVIKDPSVLAYDDALAKKTWGHKYDELFKLIDIKIKKKIVLIYSKLYSEKMNIEKFEKILILEGNAPFVDWRYPYEKQSTKHINIELLEKITNTLGKTVEALLKKAETQKINASTKNQNTPVN